MQKYVTQISLYLDILGSVDHQSQQFFSTDRSIVLQHSRTAGPCDWTWHSQRGEHDAGLGDHRGAGRRCLTLSGGPGTAGRRRSAGPGIRVGYEQVRIGLG